MNNNKEKIGRIHPINKFLNDLKNIFFSIGYIKYLTPEVELIENNFDFLNFSNNHPARKTSDTFYLKKEKYLLRTHASSFQIRILKEYSKNNINIKAFSYGKVYRNDYDDFTHSHQYTNFDVLCLGKEISISNLKWTIEYILKKIFGEDCKLRFRSSFFPFTEPSYEVDMSCFSCKDNTNNCYICKDTRWIEILGAGIVHRNILEKFNIKKNVTGFAFGIGVERLLMIKFGVKDIREFYINNIKFLKQFPLI